MPGHSPGAPRVRRRRRALLGRRALRSARSAAPTCPGADWDVCSRRSGRSSTASRPRRVVYPGHGPPTTLGRRARHEPVPRRAPRGATVKIEAPRGTHDVLPRDQPLWRHVVDAAEERLCALYGYRPIQTPVFEDTELFARTSGEGSDVVQKEMYTFEDRGGRSLTLRPEATAPICRAYLEHGLHREPQPVKLYTIAPMYRYARAAARPLPRALAALGRGDRLRRPGDRRRDDPALRRAPRRLGVTRYRLELNSIGDRDCRPAYLERLTAWLDDARRRARRRRAREARDEPAARLRRQERARAGRARRRAEDRRVALRRLPRALRRGARATSTRYGVALRARADARARPRLLHAHDLGVRRPDAIGAQSSICGGGRYDGLVEEIGGPPTPGIGFGAGIERLLLCARARRTPEPPRSTSSSSSRPARARRASSRSMAELRRRGRCAATPTTPAARSRAS